MDRLLKILVLEDRKADFELCKRYLLREIPNAMFTRAANEAEFLEKVARVSYDLIIADYNLPDYNGLQALLHVKEHFAHLPFIFLTGTLNNEEKSATAILQGANGYVLKNNISSLHRHVEKAIRDNELEKEQAEKRKAEITERNMSLRKAIGLLSQAEDFSRRDEIISLIERGIIQKTEASEGQSAVA